ncbi:hypothetical protein ACFE04_023317 [Oxalis oulophora]
MYNLKLNCIIWQKWSLIAGRVPGRTDNQIKNHWNSYLCKRVVAIKNQNLQQSSANAANSTTLCSLKLDDSSQTDETHKQRDVFSETSLQVSETKKIVADFSYLSSNGRAHMSSNGRAHMDNDVVFYDNLQSSDVFSSSGLVDFLDADFLDQFWHY